MTVVSIILQLTILVPYLLCVENDNNLLTKCYRCDICYIYKCVIDCLDEYCYCYVVLFRFFKICMSSLQDLVDLLSLKYILKRCSSLPHYRLTEFFKSNECLYLEAVGPMTQLAVQKNLIICLHCLMCHRTDDVQK